MRGLVSSAIGSPTWCIRRDWKSADCSPLCSTNIPPYSTRTITWAPASAGEMPLVPNPPAVRSAIRPGLHGSLLPAPLRGFESGNHVEDVPACRRKATPAQQVCRHSGGQRAHAPGVLAARCRARTRIHLDGAAQSRPKRLNSRRRSRTGTGGHLLFLGRLTKLKGAAELLRAIPLAEKLLGRPLMRNYRGRRSRTRESPGPCQPPNAKGRVSGLR